jgi:DNA adenine methylase
MSEAPHRYASPLRYPGGKGKLANYIKLILLQNGLVGADYVEPYAGGASVGMSLLFEDYAGHVYINDLNRGVYAFWQAVLANADELCARIEAVQVTIREWEHQREIHRDVSSSCMDLAFATFFLNRTNRSGIVSGGVIGGLDQRGPWKIDARFNKLALVRRIRKIHRFRSRITLTQIDAVRFLPRWCEPSQRTALVFLDPPYFVKGEGLYDNFYTEADHASIAQLVRRLRHPWLVSYDAAPEILRLYAGETGRRYVLSYSAAARHRGSEVMFSSSDLSLPAELPAGITADHLDRKRKQLLGLVM